MPEELLNGSGLGSSEDEPVKRILKHVTYVLATVYFLVDAVFIIIAKPIADWFARRFIFYRLRTWIRSLRPYPALALFAIPVIVLEPVKPVAAYLAATGHIAMSIAVLIVGEVLKLVLVERLFSLTRDKLVSIPAFSWAYCKFRRVTEWLEASEAWRSVRRLSKIATCAARSYVAELKSSRTPRRVSWQSR
jgi:hypothetical protein